MPLSSPLHACCLLLYLFTHIEVVFGRGGGKGGKGGVEHAAEGAGVGSDLTDLTSGLDLSPTLTAVFALTVVIAILTTYQLQRSLKRFKRLPLPEGEPTLPYDVGMLFRVFLASYTAIYLVYNIIYCVYVATHVVCLLPFSPFAIGVTFTGQLSDVLFYATLLSIIAYRQRIQLNPGERLFNLKSFLDGLLLVTILTLGVAEDGVAGSLDPILVEDTVINLSLAYKIFVFFASFDVAVSSLMVRARLSNAGIQDKIINISAFAISPIVVIGGIFGIIEIGIIKNAGSLFNFDPLLIAAVVINGTVSLVVIWCCLLMSAPPKSPPKEDDNAGGAVEKKA